MFYSPPQIMVDLPPIVVAVVKLELLPFWLQEPVVCSQELYDAE
jgi:hypothetical protein